MMADEEPTKDRSGSRSGAQVKGLDPFGGNSTGNDSSDTDDTTSGSGTGIGIEGTGIEGTAGGDTDPQLDSGGSIPQ